MKLIDMLLQYLQKKCTHPSRAVKADLLEGGSKDYAILWCERCGAVGICRKENGEIAPRMTVSMRQPRATWYWIE